MKKLLITLLLFTFYCNSSFATPNTLWDKAFKASGNPMDNNIRSYVFKSQLTCSVHTKPNKKNAFISISRCTNAANIECMILTDIKTGVVEYYCIDPITSLQFNAI